MMAMRACDWRRQWETTGEHVKEGCRPPGRHDLWYSGGLFVSAGNGACFGNVRRTQTKEYQEFGKP